MASTIRHRLGPACGLILTLLGTTPALALADIFLGFDDHARLLGVDKKDFAGTWVTAGDVSGDGVGDILVGVPDSAGLRNRDASAGELAIVFGGATLGGALELRLANATFYAAHDSANLGHGAAVGDINGDGVGDVIVGAPKDDGRDIFAGGAAYVYFGGDGLPRGTVALADVKPDITLFGTQEGRLGVAVATGDLDGDGIDDFVVSAPQEGAQFSRLRAGVLYIFYGQPATDPIEITLDPARMTRPPFTDFRIATVVGPGFDARAGRALAIADVNGDGRNDLLIGVTTVAQRFGSGEVRVIFGGNPVLEPRDGELVDIDLANPAHSDLIIRGPIIGDGFALALGTANINGDGARDLLIGAPTSRYAPGIDTGRAYAIFGRGFPRGLVLDLATSPADVTLVGPHDGAELGASVSGGDMNGDGFDEWVIGSPGADIFGQAYRLLGRADWPRGGAVGSLTQGLGKGDRAGASTTVVDVSGDQLPDLVIGSPQFSGDSPDTDALRHSGAVWVVLGVVGPETPNPPCLDEDGDGIAANGRTCGPKDCDDANPSVGLCDPSSCSGRDEDADHWPESSDTGCPIADCNDNDPGVFPGAPEVCDDLVDNDCDGRPDQTDTECGGPERCDVPNPTVRELNCTDGVDNDCDRNIDRADPDCRIVNPPPTVEQSCKNCVDDDGDLLKDLLDPDCNRTDLSLTSVVLKREAKESLTIAKLRLKTILPNEILFTDVKSGSTIPIDGASVGGAQELASHVILGISFDERTQECIPLEEDVARRKTNRLILRTMPNAYGTLRIKRTPSGILKAKYKQKIPLALPEMIPPHITVGFFSASLQFGNVTPLRTKNGKYLVLDKQKTEKTETTP